MAGTERKINILGTEYTIYLRTGEECKKLDENDAGGFCEPYAKELYVRDLPREKPDPATVAKPEGNVKHNIRHEITHAFLFESGLAVCSNWAANEELVDWIALQAPKLAKAFEEAEAL